jgi:hypothetical protein
MVAAFQRRRNASAIWCLPLPLVNIWNPDPAYRDTLEVSRSRGLSGDEERLEHLVHFWHLITGLKAARVGEKP